jgi:hypothetical protein
VNFRIQALFNANENVQGAGAASRNAATLNIGDGTKFASATVATTGHILIESYKLASLFSMTVKGVAVLAPTAGSASAGTDTNFNAFGMTSSSWGTRFAECVLYLSDQTANATGIRSNYVTYYGGV